MPKNDFWDILDKNKQKSKKNFLVIPFIYKNIKNQIKPQKFCLTKFIFKKVFF
jgi:hypothetical protein